LVTTAHEELTTSAVRVLLVGAERKIFPLYGRFLAEARPRFGRNWTCEFGARGEGALGRDNYDRVLFEDETEAHPSLVGA
jgi:hypothetical protein